MQDLTEWTPRPAPRRFSATGRFAMVEPWTRAVHEHDLWNALGGAAVNDLIRYFPNGPYADASELADWLDAVNAGGGFTTLVVRNRRTGEICGMASLMRPDPANGVIEVGAVAHAPSMQRTPIATDLHYLLAREVFVTLGYRRYEWKCHNENAPSKRTAIRLGFAYEGLFRQHIVSKGANRDTAWFSMIDGEWPTVKAAFEAWLSPDNIGGDGVQRKRLEDIRAALA